MQPLNYSRQMAKQFIEDRRHEGVALELRAYKEVCIALAAKAQHFYLPDGGRLYDDPEFRALDPSQPLRLPFPVVSIEFSRSPEWLGTHQWTNRAADVTQPRKGLLFAEERADQIVITLPVWADGYGMWVPYPQVAIPRLDFIQRQPRGGRALIALQTMPDALLPVPVPGNDYMDEVSALLCMLNVLSCSNVRVDKVQPGRVRAAMNNKRGALPFDTYHVLTIPAPTVGDAAPSSVSGPHRSPREHVRRGHIVRPDGRAPYWRNATVVNAGKGGVVTKDYCFK